MDSVTVLFAAGLCERRAAFVATVQKLLLEAPPGSSYSAITLLLEEGNGDCVVAVKGNGYAAPAGTNVDGEEEEEEEEVEPPLIDAAGYGDVDKIKELLSGGDGLVDVVNSVRKSSTRSKGF